jgi:hypothetical protein
MGLTDVTALTDQSGFDTTVERGSHQGFAALL